MVASAVVEELIDIFVCSEGQEASAYKYLLCGKVQMAKYYVSHKASETTWLSHNTVKNIVELGSYVLRVFSDT